MVTGEKKKIYQCVPETKQQSAVLVFPDENPHVKFERHRSASKQMIVYFKLYFWFSPFLIDFCKCGISLNPTIEAVSLRRWCMPGDFVVDVVSFVFLSFVLVVGILPYMNVRGHGSRASTTNIQAYGLKGTVTENWLANHFNECLRWKGTTEENTLASDQSVFFYTYSNTKCWVEPDCT